MKKTSFCARYNAAIARGGGSCPIEAGTLGRLADHECRHGRLPFDCTLPCGCWAQGARRGGLASAPGWAPRKSPRCVSQM
jgi:hypothetical protein